MAASISIKSAKANTIAEPIAIKPGWYVLAVLSMLMGLEVDAENWTSC